MWNLDRTVIFETTALYSSPSVLLLHRQHIRTRPLLSSPVNLRTRVGRKFPAWHTKAASNGKCCEGYTGCPGRNVKTFGRVFLMLKYTDITQNIYIQSWTVTEIMAREKWGLLWCPRTVSCQLTVQMYARPSVRYHITYYTAYLQADKAVHFAAECAVSHLMSEPGMQCHV
jgi:hypothetical protein